MRWWKNLSESQQKLVYWGSVCLVLIFFYLLVWLPLKAANENLRSQIDNNQTLLSQVSKAKAEIIKLRQKQKVVVNKKEPTFGVIDKAIKADHLDVFVTEFKQVSDSEIKISFANIPFDKLVAWLEELDSKDAISPYHIVISESNSVGVVAADIFVMESKANA